MANEPDNKSADNDQGSQQGPNNKKPSVLPGASNMPGVGDIAGVASGIPGLGGSIPGAGGIPGLGGSIPGAGGIPGLGSLPGMGGQGADYKDMLKTELKGQLKQHVKKSVVKFLFTNPIGLAILAAVLALIGLFVTILFIMMVSVVNTSQSDEGANGVYISSNMSDLAKTDITSDQLIILQDAEKKYEIPWSVLAAISKYKTDLGRGCINYTSETVGIAIFYCVQKDDAKTKILAVGPYGLSPKWWGGITSLTADPQVIKTNSGYGINEVDTDTISNPSDFRDSTFAVAKFLKSKHFDVDPRAAVKRLVGTDAATSAIFNFVDMYAPVIDSSIMDMPSYPGGPVSGSGGLTWPVLDSHTVTSDFGFRTDPFTKKKKFHTGLDVARPDPKKDYVEVAMANGTVVWASFGNPGTGMGGYGNSVVIDHGNGVSSLYGHMKTKPFVTKGQVVTAGTPLGIMGTSGHSTGIHLHWTIFYGPYTAFRGPQNTIHPLCVMKYVKILNASSVASQAAHTQWTTARDEWETQHPGKPYTQPEPMVVPPVDWSKEVHNAGVSVLANCQH